MTPPRTRILSDKRRLGQICLVGSVILNAFVFILNLHISNLEGELADLKDEERYFITNERRVDAEKSSRVFLHTNLNTLKMLRRLAKDEMTLAENEALLKDQKTLQQEISASFRRIALGTYLMANDPPAGEDLDEKFSSMTDEQLHDLIPRFEAQVRQYGDSLKTVMVNTMDRIPGWKQVHSSTLILSTIILVIANFLIFAAREPRQADV